MLAITNATAGLTLIKYEFNDIVINKKQPFYPFDCSPQRQRCGLGPSVLKYTSHDREFRGDHEVEGS